MRIANDNQIGAGGDHIVAYALNYKLKECNGYNFLKLSHGCAVYLGSISMAAIFQEWEFSFFSLSNLISFGLSIGIINKCHLKFLSETIDFEFIQLCLKMRPDRLTCLSSISLEDIRFISSRIQKASR